MSPLGAWPAVIFRSRHTMRALALFLATSAFVAAPGWGQETPPVQAEPTAESAAETQGTQQPVRRAPTASVHDSEEIVVTGYVQELDLLAGKSVISGEELQRDVRVQIGDSPPRPAPG